MSSESSDQAGRSGWGWFWSGVQVAGGVAEIAGGGALFAAGAVASATGVGALVGVPSMAGGALIWAHGIDQVQAGILGVPSAANQVGTAIGQNLGGEWGGLVGGVLGDIGPNLPGMIRGAAKGAKSVGQFLGRMRQAGGLPELLGRAREAGRISEFLAELKLSPDDMATMLKNKEVTLEELRAAGYNVDDLGLEVSTASQLESGRGGASTADNVSSSGKSADVPATGEVTTGGTPEPPSEYGVRFFGEEQIKHYEGATPLLGTEGKPVFFMPLEDSAIVRNAHDAARYSGMAPSAAKAYTGGKQVYGLSFPLDNLPTRLPTATDAGGFPHFVEGGHTAVRLPDPNGGLLMNSTREFVTPGTAVPPGSVLFQLGPRGEYIPVRRF